MSKSRTKSSQKSLLDFLGGPGNKKDNKIVPISRTRSVNVCDTVEDLADPISSSDDEDSTPARILKPLRSISKKRVRIMEPPVQSEPEVSEPWVDKYSPLTSSSVAMHAKKLDELQKILDEMLNGASFTKILILSGPAGSSKSAVIKAIARDHGLEVSNMSRQTPTVASQSRKPSLVEWYNPDKNSGMSLPEAFSDFLAGLTFSSKKLHPLVLVEDIPNMTHYETKKSFNQALLEWINSSKKQLPPLVIIFTEVSITSTREAGGNYSYIQDDSLITERVFSKKLLEDYRVKRVKVLPVNATLIKKTLQSIAQREPKIFTTINKQKISEAIDSLKELGDIRSAIGGFEFWARWKKRGIELSAPSARGSNLGLFHAIGRVIYGTKDKEKSKKKSDPSQESDEIAIQSVLASWGPTNRQDSFNLALFENYLSGKSCQMNMTSASSCSDILSLASLMNGYSADISSELSCRGLRTNIRTAQPTPNSKASFKPMTFSKDRQIVSRQTNVWLEYEKFIVNTEQRTGHTLSRTDAILYDGYYGPKIKKSAYRIGGAISSSFGGLDEAEYEPSQITSTQITPYPALSNDSPTGYTFSDDDIESD